MWVYTRLSSKKLKLTHINFFILNSYVKVIDLRFIKNTYFYVVKSIKFGNSCIGFFQTRKLTIT